VFYSSLFAQLRQGAITIDGTKDNVAYSMVQTNDGGYVMAGSTDSYGAGGLDVYVVKLDSLGKLQWTKTIGGDKNDIAWSIIQTNDHGYAITGYTFSFGAGSDDVYIIKLDSVGNLQWTKTIGGTNAEEGQGIVQTKDKGYAVTGLTDSYGAGIGDVYIIKLDSTGNLQWTKTIGGTNDDAGDWIIQTKDGGYAIAGSTFSYGAGDEDVYVIRLDALGNLKWTRTIGTNNGDWANSIAQTKDGGFAITGVTDSGTNGADVYVIKLDSLGNLKWNRAIGGPKDDEGFSIIQANDGGYAITGFTNSYGTGGGNVYVIRLDSMGNLKWTKVIGGSIVTNSGYSIIQTKDMGYAIAGDNAPTGTNINVYFIKLDSLGNGCLTAITDSGRVTHVGTFSHGGNVTTIDSGRINSGGKVGSGGIYNAICTVTAVDNIVPEENNLQVFPNPNNGIFSIQSGNGNQKSEIGIYNILGEEIYTGKLNSDITQIDISGQPAGLYLYRVISEQGQLVSSGKVIVEK